MTQVLRYVGGLLLVAPLLAFGCNSNVDASDEDDGESNCTEPKPEGEPGTCPLWTCAEGVWVHVGSDCPPDVCPTVRPAESSSCTTLGAECTYHVEEEPCGRPAHDELMICTDGGWTTVGPRCSPPIECPDEMPIAGSDCTGWDFAYQCSYTASTECGDLPALAFCDTSTYTWNVDLVGECQACDALLDAASCAAAPACRWLVPGCGEPPLPAEGCFPAQDCAPDSCDEGETCTTVVINPCWNSPCDACGAEALVCLGSDG